VKIILLFKTMAVVAQELGNLFQPHGVAGRFAVQLLLKDQK
jgi:hypothetical protein